MSDHSEFFQQILWRFLVLRTRIKSVGAYTAGMAVNFHPVTPPVRCQTFGLIQQFLANTAATRVIADAQITDTAKFASQRNLRNEMQRNKPDSLTFCFGH